MFYALRTRYLETIREAIDLFEEMVPVDPRAYRALTTPDIAYQSSASAPSLRAREAATPLEPMAPMRPMSSDGDSGNVKVVVRVRKFIKRGMHQEHLYRACALAESHTKTSYRNRATSNMSNRNGPKDTKDNHTSSTRRRYKGFTQEL